MPNLYGSDSGQRQSMYGNVLSERNQRQAQDLNLPGAIQQPGEAGEAGSQQAAQSDWANFEDVFNKNRGYAAKSVEDAAGSVRKAAGEDAAPKDLAQPQRELNPPQMGLLNTQVQAPAKGPAAQNVANPSAPGMLQAQTLTGIQNKADLLKGYGQTSQAVLPPGVGIVGGNPLPQLPSQPQEQPQSQSFANTAVPKSPAAPTVAQNVGPNVNPADLLAPPAAPAAPHVSAQGSVDFANKQLAGLPAQVGGKDAPTEAELGQLDKLTKANDLLKGYASDGGVDILQQTSPGATQWDADIMNTGGGRTAFGELQKQYGGKDQEYAKQIGQNVKERGDYRKSLLDQIKGYQDELNAPQAAPVDNSIRIGAMPTLDAGSALGVTPEAQAQWESLPPETISAQMMGNKNYSEAAGEKSSLPGLLTGTFGVSQEDANALTSYLTPEDWAAYQAALQQAIKDKNPKAVMAWISSMLSKNKGL